MPDLTEDPLANYDPDHGAAPRGAVSVAPGTPATPDTDPYLAAPPLDEPPAEDHLPPADFDVEPPMEFGPEDIGPPDDFEDAVLPRQRSRSDRRKRTLPPGTDAERHDMADLVIDTMRDCVAAMHHRPGSELVDLVVYMMSSDNTLAYLDDTRLRTWKRLTEVLIACASDDPNREFDLFDIPDLDAAHGAVVAEAKLVRGRVGAPSLPTTPTSTWRSLADRVQRLAARVSAHRLIDGIDEDLPNDELLEMYGKLEPPSTQRVLQNATFSRTAGDWESSDKQAEAERPLYRISSGYPTWDWSFTLKDAYGKPSEPLGCWEPGSFHAVAAGTGHGKSALSRRLVTAAAEDLVVGWGHEHAKVLIAITEEAPKIVYRAAGLAEGQPFHHLKDHVVIADVGASRRRFIHAVWDLVIEAYHKAKATGRSIVDSGLPEMIILDYIGGIVEQGENADTTAIENTANLIMRGLCGWRIEEMQQFSGESFSAYAGMAWPDGMENFKPAVLTFVQLRKLDRPEFYDPNARGCSEADYTVENADGTPGWQVKPGDYLVPSRSEIRGSGVLQNHLTSLSVAHRSRPQKNEKVVDPVTGKMRLEDDRGRIIFLKTRNGADLKFVPMRFDSNPEGLRGQYYDLLAERAIAVGKLRTVASYTQEGDPILPPRPVKSPFAGIAY